MAQGFSHSARRAGLAALGCVLALGSAALAQTPFKRVVDRAEDAAARQSAGAGEAAGLGSQGSLPVYSGVEAFPPAPPFRLKGLDGTQRSLEDYSGKAVLLHFFASTSPACARMAPRLQQSVPALRRGGVAVLGVSSGERGGQRFVQARAFRDRHRLTFPVLVDADVRVARAYGVKGYPTTVLIGPDGGIRSVASDAEAFDALIRSLVTGAAPLPGAEPSILRASQGPVTSVAWSPGGTRLAAGGDDGTIRLWNPFAGELQAEMPGHAGWINTLAWSPNGVWLVSGDTDGAIRLWSPRDGRPLHLVRLKPLTGPTPGSGSDAGSQQVSIEALDWRPDSALFASGAWDGTVRLWRPGSRIPRGLLQRDGPVTCVAWSPDGGRLAVAGIDGGVYLWSFAAREWRALRGHRDWVQSLAWRPDGRLLASGSDDGTVRVWDVTTGNIHRLWDARTGRPVPASRFVARPEASLEMLPPLFRPGPETPAWIHSLSWNREGTRLAGASWDRSVRLWDVRGNRQVRAFRGHSDKVLAVAWCPDGSALASAGGDSTVRLWRPLSLLAGRGAGRR